MAPVMGHEVGSLGEILAGCMYCVCKREGVGRERRKDTITQVWMWNLVTMCPFTEDPQLSKHLWRHYFSRLSEE